MELKIKPNEIKGGFDVVEVKNGEICRTIHPSLSFTEAMLYCTALEKGWIEPCMRITPEDESHYPLGMYLM